MRFYHDFSSLGLSLPQMPGIYAPNQAAKAPIITGYLLFAIGKLKAAQNCPVTVTELFCADAYYSFLARRFGADHCMAIDSNRDRFLDQARAVHGMLGNDAAIKIVEKDIFDIVPSLGRAGIILNCGGLYHVADPKRALNLSFALATDFLIIQSVVSLARTDPDYFESPAPGWTWGCRFSFAWLQNAVESLGGHIVDSTSNILTGNTRDEDRGSAYFLIRKVAG